MDNLKIRTALCICCSLFLNTASLALSTKSDGLDSVTLQLKWLHAFQFAGYYAAIEKGYYKDEGLFVTLQEADIGDADQVVDAVVNGNAEYGVWSSDLLKKRLQGNPVVVLAVIFQHSPYVLLSRKDSGLRIPTDLINRKIIEGSGKVELRALLAREGIAHTNIEFIVVDANNMDDLINGNADAIFHYITDQPHLMEMRGIEYSLLKPIDYGIDFYGDNLFTSETEINQNPDRVAAFRRASLKGWEYALSHENEIINHILSLPGVKQRGVTFEHLKYEAEQMQLLIFPKLIELGHMNPGRWKFIADTHVELGLIDADYNLDGFIYSSDRSLINRWFNIFLVTLAGIILIVLIAFVWIKRLNAAVIQRTKQLTESEQRWHYALEGAGEGVWDWNLETDEIFFSVQWKKMLGFEDHELQSDFDEWDRRTHPDDRDNVYQDIKNHILGKTPTYENVHRLLCKDGRYKWILDRGKVISWTDKNKALRMIGTQTDITEHKNLEQALRAISVERLEILNSMVDAVITFNHLGEVLSFNKSAELLFGYSLAEMLGQPASKLIAESANSIAGGKIDTLLEIDDSADLNIAREVEGKHKDHSVFPMKLSMAELPKGDDGMHRYIASCHDLSTLNMQREHIQRTQKMDALGQLTGGVAHDYNNILGIILGYTQLMKSASKGNDKVLSYVDNIHQAAQRGSKLTKKLLSFSHKRTTQSATINLNDLLHSNQNMLAKVLTARITLNLDLHPNIWPILIDSSDLEDAILNISINTMHAINNSGELTVKTNNIKLDSKTASVLKLSENDYVKLSLVDNGCGMEPEVLDKIFEPFFSTKGNDGTGLGLSQVYGFMERSNGAITVASNPSKGTCFELYFPRALSSLDDTSKKTDAKIDNLYGNEKILIVDDEPAILALTREILTMKGYRVDCVERANLALNKLEQYSYDLLLSDIIMPNMNGYELSNIVQIKYPHLKIQLMSGYNETVKTKLVDLSLKKSIIQKPFNTDYLLKRIRNLLDI